MAKFPTSSLFLKMINLALIISTFVLFNSWENEAFAKIKKNECGKEMQKDHDSFVRDFEKRNIKYLGLTSKKIKKAEEDHAAGRKFYSHGDTFEKRKARMEQMVAWLTARNDYVIKHEEAHMEAAGKWGKKIVYLNYEWDSVKYATAGCLTSKIGQPLRARIKTALAPDEPSSVDLQIAKDARKYIKIKKARAKCKKLDKYKRKKCLKKYKKYAWLDKYPLK